MTERTLCRVFSRVFLIPASVILAGCVILMKVSVQEGSPPGFMVSGSLLTGYRSDVQSLAVSGKGQVIWRIDVVGEALPPGRIVYGVVPSGFRQTEPSDGSPPPDLVDEQVYVVEVRGSHRGSAMFDYVGRPLRGTRLAPSPLNGG